MIGYLAAIDPASSAVSSGRPIDILRALQNRLNALPGYVNEYRIMGTNDLDLNSRIDEKAQIVQFPRAANQNYRDAWAGLMLYTTERFYPPDQGALVVSTKAAVDATIEAWNTDQNNAGTGAAPAQAKTTDRKWVPAAAIGGVLLLVAVLMVRK